MSSNKLLAWASRGVSVAQLSASLGAEVVEVVERMHGSVSRLPRPLDHLEDDRALGLSRLVYRCVKGGFEASHLGFKKLSVGFESQSDNDPKWLNLRAAMNGVCGDSLLQQGNRMAQPMVFMNEQEAPTSAKQQAPKTLLLYIHGLCGNELYWQDGAHSHATARLAKRLNARVAYLRYNSGRHISENGEDLAALLEPYCANDERIVIIGHSMGGLITRSATYYADQNGLQWPSKLSHFVTLGTPHNGAPAERLGNVANTLLMVSPYTKPLSRLGNIRSAGIRDLRFSNLLHSDWQGIEDPDHYADLRSPVALNANTQYLLVAGTRSECVTENPVDAKHDMLVTVKSAWAMSHKPDFELRGGRVSRVILPATDHLRLMWSCEVYDEIEGWFESLEALTAINSASDFQEL